MPDYQAAAQLVAARDAHRRGDTARAIRLAEQVAFAATEPSLRATAMLQLTGWLREQGDAQSARLFLNGAENTLGEHFVGGDTLMILYAMMTMEKGMLASLSGDLHKALYLMDYAESMANHSEKARDTVLSTVLRNRATLELEAGDPEVAQSTIEEALELDKANGDISHQVGGRNLLGRIYRELGDGAAARKQFTVAYHLATANGLVKAAAEAKAQLDS